MQSAIQFTSFHQLAMRTDIDDPPGIHDHNAIGQRQCRQPVSDDDRDAVLGESKALGE